MQKMKSVLMMSCLTVLLSCAALMITTPTASAMTLNDLQGKYRIVDGKDGSSGTIISMTTRNGELVGIIERVSSGAKYLDNGAVFARDFFVDNGTVRCKALQYHDSYYDMTVVVRSNGSTLEFYWGDPSSINQWYVLHRI